MIFSSFFLHTVTFSHLLHLDVLRSQIELKLKVKTEISSLCMAKCRTTDLADVGVVALLRMRIFDIVKA